MKKILFLIISLLPTIGFSADYKYIDASERIGVYRSWDNIPTYENPTIYVNTCKDWYTQVTEYYYPNTWWGVKDLWSYYWNGEWRYSGYKCLDKWVYDQLKLQETQKQQADTQKIIEDEAKKSEITKKNLEENNKAIEEAKKVIEQKQSTPILNNVVTTKKLSAINEKKAILLKKKIQILKKQLESLEKQLESL